MDDNKNEKVNYTFRQKKIHKIIDVKSKNKPIESIGCIIIALISLVFMFLNVN